MKEIVKIKVVDLKGVDYIYLKKLCQFHFLN
jgi:hypothetical protein